jgi:hypothetical protein
MITTKVMGAKQAVTNAPAPREFAFGQISPRQCVGYLPSGMENNFQHLI